MNWLLAWPRLFFVMVILNAFLIWWSCRRGKSGIFWKPLAIRRWHIGRDKKNMATEVKIFGRQLPYSTAFLTIYFHKEELKFTLRVRGKDHRAYIAKGGARLYIKLFGLWIMFLDRRGRGDSILEASFRKRRWEHIFRYKERQRKAVEQ